MTAESPPPLGPDSVLAIRREGGLAHFPGLAKPRRIRCAEYSEGQRRWLARMLAEAAAHDTSEALSGADRRVFRLDIDEEHDATRVSTVWTLILAEEQAPSALVSLWQGGQVEEDDDTGEHID
ncbi:hypothetical protein SAMN05661010_03083 [Modicisalibacter muralis]|uniref:Uncharacterized protein n=1 Tax=Modicisalibacter muralis TaxID=119000 RepID=A0A1G9PQ49_9GAMM|nr:protealysin inhibitor emfourin [Halomonas muralis]SDM00844.1 hypothetical protein SAMN05661010_03083 [Halomonas muralis]